MQRTPRALVYAAACRGDIGVGTCACACYLLVTWPRRPLRGRRRGVVPYGRRSTTYPPTRVPRIGARCMRPHKIHPTRTCMWGVEIVPSKMFIGPMCARTGPEEGGVWEGFRGGSLSPGCHCHARERVCGRGTGKFLSYTRACDMQQLAIHGDGATGAPLGRPATHLLRRRSTNQGDWLLGVLTIGLSDIVHST